MTEEYKPYSVLRGRSEHHGYVLTHSEWHPCNTGVDLAQYETGIRDPDGGFELVQHGCANFTLAERVIWHAIYKGWDASRMTDVIRYVNSRRCKGVFL